MKAMIKNPHSPAFLPCISDEAIAELSEITLESIGSVHKLQKTVTRVKLIGSSAKDLASKIKDESVTTSGK